MKTLVKVLKTVSSEFEIPFTVADLTQQDEPLVYINKAFEDLSGYEAKEVLGRNCRFLQTQKTNAETKIALREAINSRVSFWADILNTRRDGMKFWNRLVLIPFGYDENDPTHYIGIQIKVTDDQAIVENLFSQNRVDTVTNNITNPFKNILDLKRSLKYLQFVEDEKEFQEKLADVSGQISQEVQKIVSYLRDLAVKELETSTL
ncbi:MAG: PAS domain-containing protein [Bacteriovoracaceae bacterium]